jgi:anti-sigma factor RsiW
MNRRDIELLSSYLDGQLKPSEAARLEARISTDRDLRAVLEDLRSTRTLLRQLPMRKAPRNFTLTPKMVGKNPPLPRAYPAFRFVSALASLLLFFSLGLNFLVPQMASQSPAFGMGGGGAPEVFSAQAPEAAEESAAATEAPVLEAPAAEPPAELLPLPTTTAPAAESARVEETPSQKDGVTEDSSPQDQSQVQNVPGAPQEVPPPVPPAWQIVLAAIAVLSALVTVMMRQRAAERWRNK